MALLIGIDEAGFGPILGPLVVSSAAFRLEDEMLQADLWKILRKSTARRKQHLAGRLLVTDSKKAYKKSAGLHHLQRTVLACLKSTRKTPQNLNDLMSILCPDCLTRLKAYPWYVPAGAYNLCKSDDEISLASKVLTADLTRNRMELVQLKSVCLDVEFYNKMVTNVRNKSRVLFTATCSLIKHTLDNHPDKNFRFIIDRQGGRVRYRKELQKMFPGMPLKIINENTSSSTYQLTAGRKTVNLHFAINADNIYFPVSLASMLSKYLRELLVHHINLYFTALHPALKPTAGYWKDGLRFIQDINSKLPGLKYQKSRLIRCR